ncbi:MAG: peptidase M14, partial [Spirosomaceae bacterium]|nr:peptidase M14 [Spirosomataceae bacterium]
AERFQRRTSTGIDMNRDALALQTPEGRLLKVLVDELKPEFSFNLHDKGTRYSAGASGKQATVSFLATAYNQAKDWNDTRTKAMQVICRMAEVLQPIIPGHLGRWTDEFEPRAFGDNVQKWGSSLVLIESGGYKEDREKQFIRQLNFVAMLTALESIAKRDYTNEKLATYERIPNNDKYIFDLLIRNATFTENGKKLTKDIGINLNEENNETATDFTLSSEIEDLGDLSIFFGLKELDATDMTALTFDQFPELRKKYGVKPTKINLGESANLILIHKNKVKHVIVNGQIAEG